MRTLVLVLLATFASPGLAQEGIYVGIGLGNFDYTEGSAFFAPDPLNDSVSAWKVYGGFELNDHVAFEIRYGATSQIEQTFSGTDPELGNYTARFETDFAITSVLAMGVLPKEWGALFGGLGYFDAPADADFDLTTDCCEPVSNGISVDDNGVAAVLGIEWRFGRFGTGVGVRLEYEWLDVDDADASTLGLGIAYRF